MGNRVVFLKTCFLCALLSILFIQCGKQAKQSNESRQVITSFYPLYYFASQIGGDKVNVINLTPAGAEPHEYELTTMNIAQINNSRLLILNGLGLEPWISNIRKNINPASTKVILAGEGLETNQIIATGTQRQDPHVWLSPQLAKQIVDRITAGLISIDSINQQYYFAKAETLKTKLDDLDRLYNENLASCSTRDIITSHDAFGYLAASYGLRQIAITGISPNAEPSPRQLTKIASFAKQNNIKYIFFESLVSPKLAQTIANEIGAETLVLNPIEGLTKGEQSQGKDYFTLMKENLVNLEKALQCRQ